MIFIGGVIELEYLLKIKTRKSSKKRIQRIWDRLQVLEWLLQSIQAIQPSDGMASDKDLVVNTEY